MGGLGIYIVLTHIKFRKNRVYTRYPREPMDTQQTTSSIPEIKPIRCILEPGSYLMGYSGGICLPLANLVYLLYTLLKVLSSTK